MARSTTPTIAVSPDGTLLATAGNGRDVAVWTLASGQAAGPVLHNDDYAADRAQFDPADPGTLLTVGPGGARLWELAGRRVLRRFEGGHTAAVTGAAFTPDGTVVATISADGTIRLWNTTTGAPIGQPLPAAHAPISIAFSPEGRLFATGDDKGFVTLWRLDRP